MSEDQDGRAVGIAQKRQEKKTRGTAVAFGMVWAVIERLQGLGFRDTMHSGTLRYCTHKLRLRHEAEACRDGSCNNVLFARVRER